MISPEQLTALLVAVTGLVASIAGLYAQIRTLSRRVDGRLTQLLELTERAAEARGVKAGTEAAGLPSGDGNSGPAAADRPIP